LTLSAIIPGISEEDFANLAKKAKESCPLSKALGAIEVTLDAKLV
jgi:osmotically inducible protein OsmC